MSRYEEATPDVEQYVADLKKEHFEDLINARIKCVFDSKKKISKGRYVFGRITKPNDFVSFLTSNEFDYVMILDKNIWDAIEEADKIRIIRHELRHCFVDDDINHPYKLVDHDLIDFYDEVALNTDDPRWSQRIAAVAASIYTKDDEE